MLDVFDETQPLKYGYWETEVWFWQRYPFIFNEIIKQMWSI